MKKLILTRHAKSDWTDAAQSDAERSLNPRGRRSAPAIGTWLARQAPAPDLALVSSARRTVETWEGISAQLPGAGGIEMRTLDALYLAPAGQMLEVLRSLGGAAECIILIGHNPGIADLAGRLRADPAPHAQFERYPTGATTVFEFDIAQWQDLAPSSGRIAHFVLARDLTD